MKVKRTFDILNIIKEKYNKPNLLVSKSAGKWREYDIIDYIENANRFSYGLLELGFKKGDKIATVSNNRPEWNFVDMGSAQVGVIHIPIYPTISSSEYMHILNHSEVKMLIVSDLELYNKIAPITKNIPNIEYIYTFNHYSETKHWSEIVELGEHNEHKYKRELEEIKQNIKIDDVVSIIYTSGTTGVPKGVMMTHNNFISNMLAIDPKLPLDSSHKVISFLPLCHVLERLANYSYQYKGISIYYAEGIEMLSDNMKEIKPHGFITVPRVLEKIFDKIIAKGKELKGIKRTIFFWAVGLGLNYKLKGRGAIYNAKLKIVDKLIFSKWREALGGNVICIISGGAALQVRLSKVFSAAGINLFEGYGLTETAPVIAVNYPGKDNNVFGSVGKIIEGVEVKIASDGEILMKGPNLMKGYYKDLEMTQKVIDRDGWFHTGDIGKFVNKEFLKITDRKKEIFKLSTGKYVAPQVIENLLKESFFIEQLIIIGENEKFTSALISPNFTYLHDWCSMKKIQFKDNQELIQNPNVIERYQHEIDEFGEKLGKTEKIKKFRLVCEEWTSEGGELSPTLKLKRRYVMEKYKKLVKEIYSQS